MRASAALTGSSVPPWSDGSVSCGSGSGTGFIVTSMRVGPSYAISTRRPPFVELNSVA